MKARFSPGFTVIPAMFRGVAIASTLCCAGLASAQDATETSTVTLYGIADIGFTRVSGLKAGTVSQVASGIMEGSRWGLKGSEDLGGGYKAIFTLESRIELDTGATSNRPITGSQLSDRFSQASLMGLPAALQPAVSAVGGLLANEFGVNVGANGGRLFDRQAYLGVITPFGAILAGRQYTPGYETTATYDIMNTQSALAAGQIVAFPGVFEIRRSNALAYRFVKDGISGSFMYALGEVAGGADKSRLLGFNANYKTDVFAVGFGYNTTNNELGQKSLTSSIFGASMNVGASGKVSSFVARITDKNPASLSAISGALIGNGVGAGAAGLVQNAFIEAFKQDGTLFHIGYRYVTGPNTIYVAYNTYNDRRPSNADVKSYGVGYSYALSKRTDLSAVLVRYDNSANAQVAPGGNGYIGGVTASAGTDSTSLAFGIRHRF
jgi:predicted porin